MEKKRKRSVLIISIFILTILVLGTVGYAFTYSPGFSSSSNTNSNQPPVNGITNLGNQFAVSFEGQTFLLSNSPESLKEITVEGSFSLDDYVETSYYVDAENDIMAGEILSVLGLYSREIQPACYGPCEEDLPEKDCSEKMLVIRDRVENKVYKEDNCVFIEGDLRAADAFIYHLLGM